MSTQSLSIVIPLRDEEDAVLPLSAEISATLRRHPHWECLWVDDGSTDGTRDVLALISKDDPHHRSIRLRKPIGQSGALWTGFRFATGSVVITMDGDGQNDPADILRVLGVFERQRVDVVHGVRALHQDVSVRLWMSRIANAVRNALTGEQLGDVGCAMRGLTIEAARQLPCVRGMHRFVPTWLRMSGFSRAIEIPVHHRPRRTGRSKYGIFNRLWVSIGDLLSLAWMIRRRAVPIVQSKSLKSGPAR